MSNAPIKSMEEGPLFSVVIPMHNRSKTIIRALTSIFQQEFSDYEVVVVDDGSTDDSVAVVRQLANPALKLICLPVNVGVCPARNAGVDAARGQWIVFLDSDDELVPGALQVLSRRIQEITGGIARIAGAYRWDDGALSPQPLPAGQILDYAGYVQWAENLTRSDFHNTILRSAFEVVRLPDGRAYEALYHLDFAQRFKTWMLPDVVALEHQDAGNRAANLNASARASGLLRDAPDGLLAQEAILSRHAAVLSEFGPTQWRMHNRIVVLLAFLAGRRKLGLRYALAYIRRWGFNVPVAAATIIGMVGRKPLAWLQARRR